MYFWETLKQKISNELKITSPIFSYPTNSEFGDLSLACFELAQNSGKNPALIAQELAASVKENSFFKKYFSEIKAVGPYLNFFISSEFSSQEIITDIKKNKNHYGFSQQGLNKRIMIEYSNGNTHKEYHVGHLRNISYGDAIYKLLAASGYEAIPVSYINDFGIHVAKTIWNWRQDKSYQVRLENKGYLLGLCYAAASQKLVASPEEKTVVAEIMKNIESRAGEDYKLWQTTRNWSVEYFQNIYSELEINFQEIFYESEEVEAGLKLVEELKAKEILVKSEGVIIANLENVGLGVLPVIRSDGTALYPVADLALASKKFKKYNLNESIYVVDVRQSLYFKQLFKILEILGYRQKLVHLPYDFVTLPSGMMSSRTGNVITYEELKEKIFTKLMTETKNRRADWSEARLTEVAKKLTISTIKFEMLKVSADKVITFDIEEAAKFDGYTACYLQYGYARLKSIIRKDGGSLLNLFKGPANLALLSEKKEKALLLKLAKYPEIIAAATHKYNPSELTKYLFELTQLFNDYYHEINILKAEESIRRARLELIKSLAQVLNNGFSILGLQVLEEM